MSTPAHEPAAPRRGAVRPPFRSIACGVNGSRADAETTRQAAILAGHDTPLDLVAVTWEIGSGLSAQATLTASHAKRILSAAKQVARDVGVRAQTRTVAQADSGAALLDEAATHDLLVLDSTAGSRLGGITLGRPATAALHRAESSVLITRPDPPGTTFPTTILFADDGERDAEDAARVVAAIAARHGAAVTIAAPAVTDTRGHERLAAHCAAILAAGAPEPVFIEVEGDAHTAIPRLAGEIGASLIVLGSRRLTGFRALGSVSERVAHEAGCSVLVARRSDDTGKEDRP